MLLTTYVGHETFHSVHSYKANRTLMKPLSHISIVLFMGRVFYVMVEICARWIVRDRNNRHLVYGIESVYHTEFWISWEDAFGTSQLVKSLLWAAVHLRYYLQLQNTYN